MRIKASISDQYQAAVANEKALGDKLSQLKAEALDLRSRSVKYTILMREADTNRSLYDGLLQQFRELGVAGDAQSNNVSVIDKAELPGAPSSPSLNVNLILAFALGAAAATGAVWLIELLDDTFKSVEDIEERLRLPVLGVIPFYRDPDEKKSAISEAHGRPQLAACRILPISANRDPVFDGGGRAAIASGHERARRGREIDRRNFSRDQF